MVTVETFANYVGETYAGSDRQADLTRSLAVATALVANELANVFRPIPSVVVDQITLDVAMAVYQRSSNNNGQYETEAPNGPLDPLMRVKALMRPFRVTGV